MYSTTSHHEKHDDRKNMAFSPSIPTNTWMGVTADNNSMIAVLIDTYIILRSMILNTTTTDYGCCPQQPYDSPPSEAKRGTQVYPYYCILLYVHIFLIFKK